MKLPTGQAASDSHLQGSRKSWTLPAWGLGVWHCLVLSPFPHSFTLSRDLWEKAEKPSRTPRPVEELGLVVGMEAQLEQVRKGSKEVHPRNQMLLPLPWEVK